MSSQASQRFSIFFEQWMSHLEDLYKHPLMALQDESCTSLLNKFKSHHKQFYKVKWEFAHEDVLSFYSPVWLTPWEETQLWYTGWKPLAAFEHVEELKRAEPTPDLVLSEEQVRKIEGFRARVKVMEASVERAFERAQVGAVGQKAMELVQEEGEVMRAGGVEAERRVEEAVDAEVREWLEGMEGVMRMADCVRLMTLRELLGILSPIQGVSFLGAKANKDVSDRKRGKLLMGD